jgi:GST-like protein
MIELYGSGTPNVIKILFMLGETELPYTVHKVNVFAGDQFKPAFTAMNPNSKVPVIIDNDPINAGAGGKPITLFESGAILIYLAEKTGKLLPTEPEARAHTLQWLMWQMAGIGPMFGQAVHFTRYAPPGQDYSRARYLTEAKRLHEVLDRRLGESEYVAGDFFSIADIALYPWVNRFYPIFDGSLGDYPHLARWIALVKARPGWDRIRKVAAELIAQDGENVKTGGADGLDRFLGRGKFSKI